jgi:hypothetical protein
MEGGRRSTIATRRVGIGFDPLISTKRQQGRNAPDDAALSSSKKVTFN